MQLQAIDRETVMPTYMHDAAGYRGTARTAEREELGLGQGLTYVRTCASPALRTTCT